MSRQQIPPAKAIDIYSRVARIRKFEEQVAKLFSQGQLPGFVHLYIGEEAVAAGICAALRDDDYIVSTHRGHGHVIAKGGDFDRMMAELFGKADGYCKGKGGSMHIADMALGHLGANAIVGGGIPHVVGAGLSYRQFKRPSVSVAFFGDGAMQQGVLYESMNMAALWGLPVVFCCINNQYGMGTRVDRSAGRVAFDERARAFGLNAAVLDGEDVEQVAESAEAVIAAARGGKPGFITLNCFRFFGHARLDKSPYRTEQEEMEGRKKDPVAFARNQLVKRKTASADKLDMLDADVAREMDAAVEHAIASAAPGIPTIFEHVYDAGELAPVPIRHRIADILGEARQ